ncbi:MAG: hypothetical protein QXY96_05340 [Candidatus Methanomethylicaceae archaeon]
MIGIHGIISSTFLNNKIKSILDGKEKGDLENIPNGILAKVSLNKFKDDDIFYKFKNGLIAVNGVILNLKKLLVDNKANNLGELLIKFYSDNPYSFPSKLEGSFQGFIYIMKENKLIIFTDHKSSRPIFYFYDDDNDILIFSASFTKIVKLLKDIGIQPELNEESAYCLLTFGHMISDLTLVNKVKKLPPGTILTYHNGCIQLNKYYEITNYPQISSNEDEMKYEIFKKLSKAVYLEYIKDLENNYEHLALLSGGLDSRVSLALAKKLGFKNITCITYSQSRYLDQKIASKICRDHGLKHLFFPLEYGDYLIKFVDEVINFNGGLASYIGVCNLFTWLKNLNLNKYGILHTGLLGGEIFGEYCTTWKRGYDSLRYFIYGKISKEILLQNSNLQRLLDRELSKYGNMDLFKFYNIGVNAQLVNLHVINQFIDTMSPFINTHVLDYVMKIPKKKKLNKNIYVKMFNQYFQDFAWYTWEAYKVPPKISMNRFKAYNSALRLINNKLSILMPYYSMNPFDYYYRKNLFLKKGYYNIFNNNINLLKNHSRLMDDCKILFSEGNFFEKAAVITLLKAIEILKL